MKDFWKFSGSNTIRMTLNKIKYILTSFPPYDFCPGKQVNPLIVLELFMRGSDDLKHNFYNAENKPLCAGLL